jgi:hexosaminidase
MPSLLHLLPRPRELRLRSDALRLSAVPEIRVRAERPADAERARTRLRAALGRDAGLRAAGTQPGAPAIDLEIDGSLGVPAEGFELAISAGGIRLAARDRRGLNWGAGLVAQLVRQRGGELPGLEARDWPDFPVRGYMLDVSRDRVPTMETLAHLVDLLEELRLNELQLYTEHSFA